MSIELDHPFLQKFLFNYLLLRFEVVSNVEITCDSSDNQYEEDPFFPFSFSRRLGLDLFFCTSITLLTRQWLPLFFSFVCLSIAECRLNDSVTITMFKALFRYFFVFAFRIKLRHPNIINIKI
jgi:hypothetical protein